MSQEVVNAVGRRKSAVARVYLTAGGSGKITINDRPLETYFPMEIFQFVVKQPLQVTNLAEGVDVKIKLPDWASRAA